MEHAINVKGINLKVLIVPKNVMKIVQVENVNLMMVFVKMEIVKII